MKSCRYSQLKVEETVKARRVEIRFPLERKNEMKSGVTPLRVHKKKRRGGAPVSLLNLCRNRECLAR